LSLRSRLLFSIFVTLLLSLVAGATFTYWHAVKKIETEMQAAIAVGGRVARNAVDDWDATDPPRRLASLIADFQGDRHLRATLTVNGRVVRASQAANPENPAPAWFVGLLTAPAKELRVELPPVFDRYGTVLLQTDAANEVAEVWGDVGLTLGVLTIFCALVLQLQVIHPLDLVHLKSPVLTPPAVIALLRDAEASTDRADRLTLSETNLRFPEKTDDLLCRVALPCHSPSSPHSRLEIAGFAQSGWHR